MKLVLTGDKKLKKKKQVDYVHVSHYQELSVKNLWTDLKDDEQFKVYFCDEYPKDKMPARKYFFDILNTVYPFYLENIMQHAARERFCGGGEN